jgi:hypothetical protein
MLKAENETLKVDLSYFIETLLDAHNAELSDRAGDRTKPDQNRKP